MGILGKTSKKSSTKKKSKSSLGSKLKGAGKKLLGGGGGRRRSRVTPEKLAKKILVLKLQKRLWKLKYGGK